MSAVTLYIRRDDARSMRARTLLRRRGATITLVDVTDDPERLAEMTERTGGRTRTPQAFLEGRYLGGLDELIDMEERGALEWALDGGLDASHGS